MNAFQPLFDSSKSERGLRGRLRRVGQALAPSRTAWLGATVGVLVVTLLVWISATWALVAPTSMKLPLMVSGGVTLAVILGSGILLLLLAAFARLPLAFRWAALCGLVLTAFAFSETAGLGTWPLLTVVCATLLVTAVAGGAIAVLVSGRWRDSGIAYRIATMSLAFLSLGLIGFTTYWLIHPGIPRAEIPNATAEIKVTPIAGSDPAQKGEYPVLSLTYGSGDDKNRREFAEQATLRTKPVDGSKVLKGWSGFSGRARTEYWGFDEKKLPLNGRVWYPEGQGPFPLVLIVHGNHTAADFSDPGYQYLGELLASRGYILVSVDENFLNSMVTDLIGGLDSENNARGWLLLEHLRVWHAWNADEQNPFYRMVDIDRIALIGHSRGGEAVAHAAAFNRLPFNPDNGTAVFDYGYNIRSLIAIAPADGQYRPAGTWTPLTDINYFVIQGSHDSDVSSFLGLYQYDRVSFTDESRCFKSAVYVYGANHGQFNTSWGAYDIGAGVTERFLNTSSLLSDGDQRKIAEVYISAFLDCTLRGQRQYEPLFRDARAGAEFLPDTIYLTQYADSTTTYFCTYDEDLNLTTTIVPGGQISMANLTLWREGTIKLRAGPTRDRAVFLGWDREVQPAEPSYTIAWPNDKVKSSADSVLTFALADASEDPTPDDPDDDPADNDASSETNKKKERENDEPREPLDLTLEVIDANGHTARLPLSHFSRLQPQIKTEYFKSEFLHSESMSEPIFQTFLFSLGDFQRANSEFDPATFQKLRLIFDRTSDGVVILDKIGLQQPALRSTQ